MHEKIDIIENFEFIRQIIYDAFQTKAHLYRYPYENLEEMDYGFRKMVWKEYPQPDPITEFDIRSDQSRMLVIKSNLGFYNIIVFLSGNANPDFIGIGPFQDEESSDENLRRVLKRPSLSPEFINMAQWFYRVLPTAKRESVISLVRHLLGYYLPEFHSVVPEDLNYSEETHEVIPDTDTLENLTFHAAEAYAEALRQLLESLVTGNASETCDKFRSYLENLGVSEVSSASELAGALKELNVHYKGKLLSASVHPYYVLRLFYIYESSFRTVRNTQRLMNVGQEMSRKYALLANQYGFTSYSYTVRNAIHYIELHLAEELTLSVIAAQFHKNPSALSGQFSKETGKSITVWIREQRIKEALRYFNTTELSVAEVAEKVGILDFGYFSRLFKKQVGCSPNYYRKMMRRSEN